MLIVIYSFFPATTSLSFKEASHHKLAEKLGRVLATASDWEGRRPKHFYPEEQVEIPEINFLDLDSVDCDEK